MARFSSASVIIACVCLLVSVLPAAAGQPSLVMIDPGHGGRDKGVAGPGALMEKTLVLDLAKMLAAELPPRYRAALTRAKDRPLTPEARAGAANRSGAALFISLHVGGAIDSGTALQTVYYHQGTGEAAPGREDTLSWDRIQERHLDRSRRLAETVAMALVKLTGQPATPATQVRAAPLTVLKGVDMPAVVVELGHLTHPLQAHWLADPANQQRVADALAAAVISFLGTGD